MDESGKDAAPNTAPAPAIASVVDGRVRTYSAGNKDELREVYRRLQKADRPVLEEGETTCCYAKSEKSWIADPQGVSWETFLTSGESTDFGDDVDLGPIRTTAAACCTPADPNASACCAPKEAAA